MQQAWVVFPPTCAALPASSRVREIRADRPGDFATEPKGGRGPAMDPDLKGTHPDAGALASIASRCRASARDSDFCIGRTPSFQAFPATMALARHR